MKEKKLLFMWWKHNGQRKIKKKGSETRNCRGIRQLMIHSPDLRKKPCPKKCYCGAEHQFEELE